MVAKEKQAMQKSAATTSIKNLAELGMPIKNAGNVILKEEMNVLAPMKLGGGGGGTPQPTTKKQYRPA